jgi:Fe-S-cluster-containing dehydrogenase component
MARYGMAIDVNKCIGCYNCFLTCRDEFAGNEYPGYSAAQSMSGGNWITVKEVERGKYPYVKVDHIPITCSHCDSAACLELDQTGAIYRRPDGIIMIDPEKAKGNKELVNFCPYRQIEWNAELEVAQKCTMCAHLLDKGDPEPRCVESCPSGALTFGDLDDPNSEVSKLHASGDYVPLSDEYGMNEKVLYRKLPQKFIAGTVIYADVDELADGVEVVLNGPDGEQTITTNGFGDFEFEDLALNVNYTIKINVSDYKEVTLNVKTSKDVYLGEIELVR